MRQSLSGFVGPDVLPEINITPPVDGRGELSYLRLVAWSYALLFEAGGISIPFLLRIEEPFGETRRSLELVRAMRTWSFHNLGLTSDRDMQISRTVHRWFLDACDKFPPVEDVDWDRCFDCLVGLVLEDVQRCQRAVTKVLLSDDDGVAVINDLMRRVERSWPPHRFDELLADVSTRLGFSVNIVKFRNQRLRRWRSFLDTVHRDDDPVEAVTRVIEKDLLEHNAGLLPISGRDIVHILDIDPGPKVGALLRHVRYLVDTGTSDREDLLEALKQQIGKQTDAP